jgi:class 3 adenylate cyclase/tetratricopeptide (TPR) repeat protein
MPESAGTASERRVVTVLFADVAGFTAISEKLDPETVTDAMNAIFGALGAEVEAVGGHVDKVIGDSLMALFGAPVAHEDDALRAVRAATAMHRAILSRETELQRALDHRIRLRIGIHSGLVVWGAVGPQGHAHPTVMGDVVNLASRLQRAAPEGKTLISQPVYRQVRDTYVCTALEPMVVKGKAEPVTVYEVVGAREHAERLAGPPFIDREDEIGQLHDLLARAARGRAQTIVVVGEPGIGKTRLVEEFTRRHLGDAQLLAASCPPYGGISLGPLADLFRQLTGLRGTASLSDLESRIPFGDRAAQAASALGRLFGIAEVPAGTEVPHETALLVAAEAIRRMLTRPTVVWIEDAQWADAGTLELLPFMVDRMTESPLLLIVTQRPDAPQVAWGRRTALTTLQLGALAPAYARAFLAALVEPALPRAIEDALLHKASGNPFYLNEMVSAVRGSGSIVLDDHGQWRLTGSPLDVLPDTVQGAVLARLDRLSPTARQASHLAAVVGASFPRSLLADVGGDLNVADALDALEDADIVRHLDPLAADPEYEFTHPLVREVAYNSLVTRQRTTFHQQIAETLERRVPNAGDDLAKVLGTHFARGSSPARAVPYLTQAGAHAAARYATREAIELLEEARRQADQAGAPEAAITACELLGDLYLRVHDRGPKAWLDVWSQVRAHTDSAADPVRRARASIRAALALTNDNQGDEAATLLGEAEALIPSDHPLWSDLHRVRALTLIMATSYREALDAARAAVAVADRVGSLEDRSRAHGVLAHPAILPLLGDEGRAIMQTWVAEAAASGDERLLIEARHFYLSDVWTRGLVDADVLQAGQQALHRSVEHGWTRDEAALRLLLGWASFITGAWPQAREHIARAHDLIQLQGGRLQGMYHILLPLFRGHLAMGAGRLDEARQIFQDALPLAPFHAPIWLNHDLAVCLSRLGEIQAASAAMDRSIEARDRWRCIICGCQADGVAAEFYAALGDPVRARDHAERAEAVAQDIGHVTTRIRARRAWARLAIDAGDPARAEAQAADAVALGMRLPLRQPLEHALSLTGLAAARRLSGDRQGALSALEEARGLLGGLGAAWHLEQVNRLMQEVRA